MSFHFDGTCIPQLTDCHPVHLPEPSRKLRKLDNHDPAPNQDANEHDQSHDYLATPKPLPRCENPAVDHTALGELLYHKSTRILEARLVASGLPDFATLIPKLFSYLFLSTPYPCYQSICFGTPKSRDKAGAESRSTYYARSSFQLAIFTYILKRISCLPIIEAEGYRINDHYSSATDAAFIYFLDALLKQFATRFETDSAPARFEKSEEHGCTLMMEDERAIRAFEIFTQHPMKFLVQMKVGQLLQKEEVAVVWCQDVGTEGGWDVVWEYMTKSLAAVVCPKENYEF